MSKTRKHHFLPQFYLRGFSDDGKTVLQIEKRTGRRYRCSVKDAAAIRDYHKLDHPNVSDHNALEKKLAEIEHQFAQNLADVLVSGLSTLQRRCRLVEFVALLRVRVPAVKHFMEKHLQEAVRATGKLMDRKGKLPKRPKGFEDKLSFDQISISISNWKVLEFMVSLAADPEISKILASMQPIIFRAPSGAVFLTSDQPVAVFHPEVTANNPYGGGLIETRTEVSVPLSSGALLQLKWLGDTPMERIASSDELEEFNRRTVIMAESLIFAPVSDSTAPATVSRYANYSAGLELGVFNGGSSIFQLVRNRPVLIPENYCDNA